MSRPITGNDHTLGTFSGPRVAEVVEISCNLPCKRGTTGKRCRIQQEEEISLGAAMLGVERAGYESADFRSREEARKYSDGDTKSVTLGSGGRSERAFQSRVRDG